MYNPLVSIIIPAYNASDFLSQAIDSALAQTYANIEIIVVNDGSRDGGKTEAICLAYGDKLRYFRKENGGCASALNFGIGVMRGEWFSWLSHDDLYLPEKIEHLLAELTSRGLDAESTALVSDSVLINAGGEVIPCPFRQTRGLLTPAEAFTETLVVKTFNGCGMLIPKKIIDKTGLFLTEFKHQLDREYWMRIAAGGYSFFVTDKKLVKNRVHNAQITVKQSALLFAEEEKLINDYSDRILADPALAPLARGLCFFAYKRKHYAEGKKLKAYLKSAGRLRPSDSLAVLRYTLYGKLRLRLGNAYRRVIRR